MIGILLHFEVVLKVLPDLEMELLIQLLILQVPVDECHFLLVALFLLLDQLESGPNAADGIAEDSTNDQCDYDDEDSLHIGLGPNIPIAHRQSGDGTEIEGVNIPGLPMSILYTIVDQPGSLLSLSLKHSQVVPCTCAEVGHEDDEVD